MSFKKSRENHKSVSARPPLHSAAVTLSLPKGPSAEKGEEGASCSSAEKDTRSYQGKMEGEDALCYCPEAREGEGIMDGTLQSHETKSISDRPSHVF